MQACNFQWGRLCRRLSRLHREIIAAPMRQAFPPPSVAKNVDRRPSWENIPSPRQNDRPGRWSDRLHRHQRHISLSPGPGLGKAPTSRGFNGRGGKPQARNLRWRRRCRRYHRHHRADRRPAWWGRVVVGSIAEVGGLPDQGERREIDQRRDGFGRGGGTATAPAHPTPSATDSTSTRSARGAMRSTR